MGHLPKGDFSPGTSNNEKNPNFPANNRINFNSVPSIPQKTNIPYPQNNGPYNNNSLNDLPLKMSNTQAEQVFSRNTHNEFNYSHSNGYPAGYEYNKKGY